MPIYLGDNNITGGFTTEEKKQFNNSINLINEQLDDKVNKTDIIDKTDIVDTLTSTDTDKPLSANQGKVLKTELDKKASKTYLGRYEFSTGNNLGLLYIGKIDSVSKEQAFASIEVRGGRVDGDFGRGYIHISSNGRVVANLEHPLSAMTFFVTKEGDEAKLYCTMDTYCILVVDVANGSRCEVIGKFVDSSLGTISWNNAWQELATMDRVKDGYAKIIKNNDTDTNDAMFIAYKNKDLFGIRIYKDDKSEHELRFSASGISYVKDGVTVWTK